MPFSNQILNTSLEALLKDEIPVKVLNGSFEFIKVNPVRDLSLNHVRNRISNVVNEVKEEEPQIPTLAIPSQISEKRPIFEERPKLKQPVVEVARPQRMIGIPENKRKIEDVKFRPKLVGPLEEISSLDIEYLRSLEGGTKRIQDEVLEKINLLSLESLSQKAEGIKAWRSSPIYRLYLDIGQESVTTSRPVTQVIAQRGKEGRLSLTQEEFKIIADLNEELRF